MTTDSALERLEIIAVVTSIQPLIDAYKRGDLSEEEKEFLKAVAQSVWPTMQSIITDIWKNLEPILIKLGLYPPIDEVGE